MAGNDEIESTLNRIFPSNVRQLIFDKLDTTNAHALAATATALNRTTVPLITNRYENDLNALLVQLTQYYHELQKVKSDRTTYQRFANDKSNHHMSVLSSLMLNLEGNTREYGINAIKQRYAMALHEAEVLFLRLDRLPKTRTTGPAGVYERGKNLLTNIYALLREL